MSGQKPDDKCRDKSTTMNAVTMPGITTMNVGAMPGITTMNVGAMPGITTINVGAMPGTRNTPPTQFLPHHKLCLQPA